MSFSRRLAAGITTVGASVLIVLAPGAASAATATDATAVTDVAAVDVVTVVAEAAAEPVAVVAEAAAEPVAVDQVVLTPTVAATTTEPQRGGAGYGATGQEGPDGEVSPATGTAPATTPAAPPTATATPTRGGPGYTPPTTTPPTTTPPTTTPPSSQPSASPSVTPETPGGIAGSKTPTGVKSAAAKVKKSKTPSPAGIKDASLPVTGPTLNGSLAIGGLLVAAGALTVWLTRRRRAA